MTNINTNTGDYNTGDYNTGHYNAGNYNTGNWNTGYRNTGHRNTGNYNAGDNNTGDGNTGDRNTGDWNTGYRNTGYRNTGDRNTGDNNAGDNNTGDGNTGNWNTGYRNAGNYNTGNWNTGNWNTITPDEILIFNKPGKREDLANADIPEWMLISLTSWVSKSEMTDKEKEAYPSYVTTGGYLKVYSCLKAAYIEAWEKADKEDRDKTFKLPNFDPVVFEEIFGFNPCDCVEEKREHEVVMQDIITINGIKYRKVD